MDRDDAARADNDRQDKIAEKHGPKIAAAIREAMEAVARGLPTGGRADPPLDHFPRIEAALRALYRETTREQAASMIDRFKSGFTWLENKAQEDGFYDRVFEQYLFRFCGQKIGQISETTRRQIVAVIERGLKQGLSLDEIADDLLQQAPILSDTRAAVIARTETHSAAMFASLQSAKRSTIPLNKEWVSVEDARTRDFGEGDGIVDDFSHRAMDGVTVPMDDPYEVPTKFGITEQLQFPGDPAGSPANVINCRCSQTYVPADEEDEEAAPAKPVAKPAGSERDRILDRIYGEQPIFASAHAGAMDAANILYLKTIEKAGDFKRLFYDPDGAYHWRGEISMGKHMPGTEDYGRVFRHEHGHFIDNQIGGGKGPFGSWVAIKALLKDGDELLERKAKDYPGEKGSAVSSANAMKLRARKEALFDEYDDGDELLRALIPEVEPDDIWRMYGASNRDVENAAWIGASWEARDVAVAIDDLPRMLTGRQPSHASAFAGLQDTFEASTGGNVRIYYGHGKNYYSERNKIATAYGQTIKHGRYKVNGWTTAQAFANFMDAYGDPNPASLALYRRLYPRTAAAFEEMLEEFVDA